MIAEVPLGEWLPDLADYKNPGVVTCNNCYPTAAGYGPFLGPVLSGVTVSSTVAYSLDGEGSMTTDEDLIALSEEDMVSAGEVRGAQRFERSDGTVVIVVGTTQDLFVIVGGVATETGLGLSLPDDVYWSFEQFNKQVWAFAAGVTPQYIVDIDAGTAFVPHPGIAPMAANGGRVADFMVTSNLTDIDASVQPYRIRWSPFNNPAGDYVTDIATQSSFVDMPQDLGPVVGVYGGSSNVVLQKYGVSRLTYTGGSSVFRRDTIERQRGCVSKPSVVGVGDLVYFLSNDGFCRTDGATVQVISSGKVFSWFLENASTSFLQRVQGAVNWPDRCIVWTFIPTDGAAYGRQIIYSWEQNRWSTASATVSWLFETNRAGLSLEEYAALYPNLDTAPTPLDSGEFKAGDRALAVIVGNDLGIMAGPALSPEWETGDFQPQAGSRVCSQAVYPLIENQDENTTIAIGSRATFKGEAVDFTPQVAVGSGGFAPLIRDGRFLRARIRIPAGSVWDKASGVQVEFKVTGRV